MKKCEFILAWIGPCGSEVEGNYTFCKTHDSETCCSCGEKATKECSETMELVCGAPLCNECEHTIRENGCNSGVPLPEGVKGHIRKGTQIFKPWYIKDE